MVRPVKPDTIAKSLAIGNPADGPYVLDIARRTGGAVEDVDDDEVVDAIKLLARTEGIFAETAGGVTVGVLRKLIATGCSTPPPRPWCSTPATGSRRWTRCPATSRADRDHPPDPCRVPRGWTSHECSVRIPTILRTYTGGQAEVTAEGATLGEVSSRWKRTTRVFPPGFSTTRESCAVS